MDPLIRQRIVDRYEDNLDELLAVLGLEEVDKLVEALYTIVLENIEELDI